MQNGQNEVANKTIKELNLLLEAIEQLEPHIKALERLEMLTPPLPCQTSICSHDMEINSKTLA